MSNLNGAISPDVYSEMIDGSGFTSSNVSEGISMLSYIFSPMGEDGVVKLKTSDKAGSLSLSGEYGDVRTDLYGDFAHAAVSEWCKGGLNAYACRLTAADAKKASVYLGLKPLTVDTGATVASTFYKIGDEFSSNDILFEPKTQKHYVVIEDIFNSEERYANQSGKLREIYPFDSVMTIANGDLATFTDDTTGIILIKKADTTVDPVEWNDERYVVGIDSLYESAFYSEASKVAKETAGFITIGKFEAIGSGSLYNGMFVVLNTDEEKTNLENGVTMTNMSAYTYDKRNELAVLPSNNCIFSFAEHLDINDRVSTADKATQSFASTIRFSYNLVSSDNVTALLAPVIGKQAPTSSTSINDLLVLNVFTGLNGKRLIISGGNEGSLIKPDGSIDADVRNNLISDFYSGNVDASILDANVVPARFMFNLQQSDTISKIADEFTSLLRDDIFMFHTSMDYANPEALIKWRKRSFTVSNKMSSIFAGHKDVIDSYTKSPLRVPMLYLKIASWSKLLNDRGLGGAVLGGFDSVGLIGGLGKTDIKFSKPYQDKAYLSKVNPPVVHSKGLYYVATRTTQLENSKLSMCHVSYCQAQMGQDMEVIGKPFVDKFITPKVISDIKQAITDYYLNNWLPTNAVKSFDVQVGASEFDEQNNQVRVTVEVEFTNILEKLLITRIVK